MMALFLVSPFGLLCGLLGRAALALISSRREPTGRIFDR
jgi:hypothetical protein